jgi:hypothetical protein
VLLDAAPAVGVDWLAPDQLLTRVDLNAAERIAGVRVDSGDGLFVYTGLERRAATVTDPAQLVNRAGSDLTAVEWLRERDIAGDCVERLPISETVLGLPLHQSASPRWASRCWTGRRRPSCSQRVPATSVRIPAHRRTLATPGATGSPVNPIPSEPPGSLRRVGSRRNHVPLIGGTCGGRHIERDQIRFHRPNDEAKFNAQFAIGIDQRGL